MFYHVVAMAKNRVIGKDNRLPWHFKSDMKHFKELTLGHTVIMGRKTFESIGRPLPGRENFVLSRTSKEYQGVRRFDSVEKAFKEVKTKHCFVIGGSQVYKETLSHVKGIYLTAIDQEFEGDTFYPEIPTNFKEISRIRLQDEPKIEVVYYGYCEPRRSRDEVIPQKDFL
jgi:dihydrofolate reductase